MYTCTGVATDSATRRRVKTPHACQRLLRRGCATAAAFAAVVGNDGVVPRGIEVTHRTTPARARSPTTPILSGTLCSTRSDSNRKHPIPVGVPHHLGERHQRRARRAGLPVCLVLEVPVGIATCVLASWPIRGRNSAVARVKVSDREQTVTKASYPTPPTPPIFAHQCS